MTNYGLAFFAAALPDIAFLTYSQAQNVGVGLVSQTGLGIVASSQGESERRVERLTCFAGHAALFMKATEAVNDHAD